MSLVGAGIHNNFAFGVPHDSKAPDGINYVSQMTKIPVNTKNIACVATGSNHTVLVGKDGRVYAAGSDINFEIGGQTRKIYECFTEVRIITEKIVWAAAGNRFTLYLSEKGDVFISNAKTNGLLFILTNVVSVFAGKAFGAAITDEGVINVINLEDIRKLKGFSFPAPAIEIACFGSLCAVLLSNNDMFVSEDYKKADFICVGKRIKKITGYHWTCLALSYAGTVFSLGSNQFGQLGNGTNNNFDSFKVISSLANKCVKDIACSVHSLFLTDDGKLYGCGQNRYSQLFKQTNEENVLTPILISSYPTMTSIFAGEFHSLALCDCNIESPSRAFFGNPKSISIYLDLKREIKELKKQRQEEMVELRDLRNEVSELKIMLKRIIDETIDGF